MRRDMRGRWRRTRSVSRSRKDFFEEDPLVGDVLVDDPEALF